MPDPHPRFRVLLVVRDAAERSALQLMLDPDFELSCVGTPEEARALLGERAYEVMLIGQNLDGDSGAAVAEEAATLPRSISCILICDPADDLTTAQRNRARLLTVIVRPWHAARLVRLLEQSARLTLARRAADALQKRRAR